MIKLVYASLTDATANDGVLGP